MSNASPLLKLLSALPQPPKPATHDYSGLQYKWKMFVFRPAEFKFEAIMLGILGGYLLIYVLGKYVNMGRAASTLKPFQQFYQSQFSLTRPLVSSGPALHLLYSTGRRNVLFLHTTLVLTPLHDLFGLIMHYGQSLIEPTHDTSESVKCELTLGRGEEGKQGEGLGVFAIVEKGAMTSTRSNRWDLSFARLHESASVPMNFALFTEHSEITDVLLKTPNVGISDLLANPQAANVLKYLLVTDQPAKRPTKGALPAKFRARQIILSFKKPSSTAESDAVLAWLQVALNIADLIAKPNLLKPDVARKLVKTRQEVDSDLGTSYAKEKAEDAPAQETAEEKRLARKKAERAQMSDKELKKLEELEKKREMRKMQKKQMSK